MSSSTSSSRKPARRWLFATLGLAVVLVGLLIAFNYWVDPFAKRDSHSLEFDRSRLHRNVNVPLWTTFALAKLPAADCAAAEVVILGDSRATLLTADHDNFRLAQSGGLEILNLSIGGGSLEENISCFKEEQTRSGGYSELRRVIFTTPLIRFTEPPRPNRIEQSLPMRSNPLLYYSSGFTLKRSLASLRHLQKSGNVTASGRAATVPDVKVLARWTRVYKNYNSAIATQRLQMLREFAEEMGKRGVEVQFYMPPGQGSTTEVIESVGLVDIRARVVATLRQWGIVTDMAYFSEIDGESFEYKPGDPIHHDKGDQVLKYLLEKSAILN